MPFFASKRNEIFALISIFASKVKTRAHPTGYTSTVPYSKDKLLYTSTNIAYTEKKKTKREKTKNVHNKNSLGFASRRAYTERRKTKRKKEKIPNQYSLGTTVFPAEELVTSEIFKFERNRLQ